MGVCMRRCAVLWVGSRSDCRARSNGDHRDESLNFCRWHDRNPSSVHDSKFYDHRVLDSTLDDGWGVGRPERKPACTSPAKSPGAVRG